MTVQRSYFIREKMGNEEERSDVTHHHHTHQHTTCLTLNLRKLEIYASAQLQVNSHRWSAWPDQVLPLFRFFPSMLWSLEG